MSMGGHGVWRERRATRRAYDDQCAAEFAVLMSRIEHLFVDIDIACPYGLPEVATFHQAVFAPLGERAMELFLSAGYRRNGNCLYNMHCARCRECIAIRLHPADFKPNRNQRRTRKNNGDVAMTIKPLRADEEDVDLCDRFLRARYPRGGNRGRHYYRDFFLNSLGDSIRLQFRVDGRLVGTSIVDIGYNWLNAVYFYFDPGEAKRSLGTYNILRLVELCRDWEVEFLYLGYLIRAVPAMSYKANFSPHYLLGDDGWCRG